MTDKARAALAEAMGLVPNDNTFRLCADFSVSKENWRKLIMFLPDFVPDPFTDSHDCDALATFLLDKGYYIDIRAGDMATLECRISVYIYQDPEIKYRAFGKKLPDTLTRAACKVLKIDCD